MTTSELDISYEVDPEQHRVPIRRLYSGPMSDQLAAFLSPPEAEESTRIPLPEQTPAEVRQADQEREMFVRRVGHIARRLAKV